MITNQESAVQNFEAISSQLIASASTEKARAFAEKTINAVRAKGAEWIFTNAQELQVTFVPGEMFPVRDNRTYYMAAFQMALMSK